MPIVPCVVTIEYGPKITPELAAAWPVGEITALYPTNLSEFLGEGCLERSLECFRQGTGHLFVYSLEDVDTDSIRYIDSEKRINPIMLHPDYCHPDLLKECYKINGHK